MLKKENEKLSGGLIGLNVFMNYHWLMIAKIKQIIEERFGHDGMDAVATGFREYGFTRGQFLRDLPEVIENGRNPLSLLRYWDTGEIALAQLQSAVQVTGTDNCVELVFREAPGQEYFRYLDQRDILNIYWREFLAGMASGFDDSVTVTSPEIDFSGSKEWTITFSNGRETGPLKPLLLPAHTTDVISLTKLNRRTIGALGALITNVGRALRKTYDAAADVPISEYSYAFGAARGKALREQHLNEGKSIDFQSFFSGLQTRDTDENVFVFRSDRFLSPGVLQIDCTYCPLAEVWLADGPDGLELAYLFDKHNHLGLVESYHPDALVRWDSVKSRGDRTCKFRFVIPSLISKTDPEWAQKLKPAS